MGQHCVGSTAVLAARLAELIPADDAAVVIGAAAVVVAAVVVAAVVVAAAAAAEGGVSGAYSGWRP